MVVLVAVNVKLLDKIPKGELQLLLKHEDQEHTRIFDAYSEPESGLTWSCNV